MSTSSMGPSSRRSAIAWLDLVFWLVGAALLIAGLWVAAMNRSVGTWDAAANLVTARNMAEGRGFTTEMVQDLVVPHELPGPETVRAPGAIYVIAAVFRMTGVNLATLVILYDAWIVLSAIVLRAAVGQVAPRWLANIAGLLMLLGANNYVIVPYVNNNLLVLLTVLALWLAAWVHRTSAHGWWIAVVAGALDGGRTERGDRETHVSGGERRRGCRGLTTL